MSTSIWSFTYKPKGRPAKLYVGWSMEYLGGYVASHNKMFGPRDDGYTHCSRCGGRNISIVLAKFRLFHIWCCIRDILVYTDAVYNGEFCNVRMMKCDKCDNNHFLLGNTKEGKTVGNTTNQVIFVMHEAKMLPAVVPQTIPPFVNELDVPFGGFTST